MLLIFSRPWWFIKEFLVCVYLFWFGLQKRWWTLLSLYSSHQNDPLMLPNKLYICIFLSKVTFNVITINNGNRTEWSPICLGNSTVSRGIWDKYHEWYYFKIHQNITSCCGGEWYLGSPVYTTRQRNFAHYVAGVIFTCKCFKFGLNTTGRSQSHFRNLSACSIRCVIIQVINKIRQRHSRNRTVFHQHSRLLIGSNGLMWTNYTNGNKIQQMNWTV